MKNYEEPKFVLENVAKIDLLANSNGNNDHSHDNELPFVP